MKSKSTYGAKSNEWDSTFEYIRNQSDKQDNVKSDGDAML